MVVPRGLLPHVLDFSEFQIVGVKYFQNFHSASELWFEAIALIAIKWEDGVTILQLPC